MYIPKAYTEIDIESTIDFMRNFSFATIITSVNNKPIATHLPFVITAKNEKIILTSHFAIANPQWKNIEDKEILVIFSEPHAYISPKNYNKKESVPTWNYLSVHTYGKARIINNKKEVFNVLESMINSFEATYKKQWNDISLDYKERMANGIVAFKIEVSEIQSKKKLSQNKSKSEQEKIINTLAKSNNTNEKLIAHYMKSNKK